MAHVLRASRLLASVLRQQQGARHLSMSAPVAAGKIINVHHWAPGPYPVTEAEKCAAAAKYGLRREDYEPYPDDGFGFGDYPMLPRVGGNNRDKYEDFDFPEMKRNFAEPFHVDCAWMQEHAWDPEITKHGWGPYSMLYMFCACFGTLGLLMALHFASLLWAPYFQPVLPRQHPSALRATSKKHYSFPGMENGLASGGEH